MSYMHMPNLYRPEAQAIWELKRVAASEKADGTGATVAFRDKRVWLSSGAASAKLFADIMAPLDLQSAFERLGHDTVTVYGEACGGKIAGMRETYGEKLWFVSFEVQVGETWLSPANAEDVAGKLGLEFVPWRVIPCEIEAIDAERDRPSELSVRHGIAGPKKREGIVIRPTIELVMSNGQRLMAKHKNKEWQERSSEPAPLSAEKLAILTSAREIADEWVNDMRLSHALQRLAESGAPATSPRDTERVIAEVVSDVMREGAGELVDTREARRAISLAASKLYLAKLKSAQ